MGLTALELRQSNLEKGVEQLKLQAEEVRTNMMTELDSRCLQNAAAMAGLEDKIKNVDDSLEDLVAIKLKKIRNKKAERNKTEFCAQNWRSRLIFE